MYTGTRPVVSTGLGLGPSALAKELMGEVFAASPLHRTRRHVFLKKTGRHTLRPPPSGVGIQRPAAEPGPTGRPHMPRVGHSTPTNVHPSAGNIPVRALERRGLLTGYRDVEWEWQRMLIPQTTPIRHEGEPIPPFREPPPPWSVRAGPSP